MEFKGGKAEVLERATAEGEDYNADIRQYGKDSSACADQWYWGLAVKDVRVSGVLPTRAMAEQACRDSLEILRETNALIADLVDGIRDPQTSATCGSCDGSGEGSADGTRYSSCKGMGEVGT